MSNSPQDGDLVHAPSLFPAVEPGTQEQLQQLFRSQAVRPFSDSLLTQLCELMVCRDPSIKDHPEEQLQRAHNHLGKQDPQTYGTWVFYPWSGELAHVLPQQEFWEVRSSRNKYKITQAEQDLLRTRRVGIVGLSVGYAVAQVLAMEGSAAEYRLADFDTVSLSNLNRLPCSICDIGKNKAVLAARRIAEFDPYVLVRVFPDGLREDSVDEFITANGRLDLLIEECDDLGMKLLLRERARHHRVAVLMETNDRGMLDVERFDLEPQRPIFHGLLGATASRDLKGLTAREKVPFVLRLLGERDMSQRLAASLVEIDKTIVSWPQLGSGSMLGGGAAGDTARRVLTDELKTSGRFYVDIHKIIADQPQLVSPVDTTLSREDMANRERRPESATRCRVHESSGQSETLTPGLATRLVQAAIMAPSGGNAQAWRFVSEHGERLLCMLDSSRAKSFLDFEMKAAVLSIGAAVENIRLAAIEAGYETVVRPFPRGGRDCVCEITLRRLHSSPSELDITLASAIPTRSTNRRLGKRLAPAESDLSELQTLASVRGTQLHVLTSSADLAEVGSLLGEADRFRFFCEPLYREMMSEMRWNPAETERTRDGIDIATLELPDVDEAGVRLLSSWNVVKVLKRLGLGSALEDLSKKAVASASAVALLSRRGRDDLSYFHGGGALQALWLAATARNLSIQPMSTLPYVFYRLASTNGFEAAEAATLRRLRERYERLFSIAPDSAELLLFRIAKTGPPTVRSLRRPVEEVLVFD